MISNFRETVANNKFSFANSEKIFAVSDVETLEAFAIENPYMDIEIANHVYIYILLDMYVYIYILLDMDMYIYIYI